MTTAGRRDTLVSIQRYSSVQDDYGEETQTWAELGKEWAAMYFGTGIEKREAAREQGEQTATFNVRANDMTRSLTIRDRIVDGSDNWDIVSTGPVRRSEVDIVAKRAA